MKQKLKQVLLYALQPRTVILFISLSNFVWFFAHSRTVKEFGSDVISFCVVCAWYWEGTFANLPLVLLIAALFMLANRWWGYLAAAVISGQKTIEGIIWVSQRRGFTRGLSERFELISNNFDSKVWQFLDWQFLLALIIFIIASGYLIASISKSRKNTVNSC